MSSTAQQNSSSAGSDSSVFGAETASVLEGDLRACHILGMMDLISAGKEPDGVLYVNTDDCQGELQLARGQWIRARFGGLEDDDALLVLSELDQGQFRFLPTQPDPSAVTPDRVLSAPKIAMVGAWLEDESDRLAGLLPGPRTLLMPGEGSVSPSLKDPALLRFKEVHETIVSHDGMTVAELLLLEITAPSNLRVTVARLLEMGALTSRELEPTTTPITELSPAPASERSEEAVRASIRPGRGRWIALAAIVVLTSVAAATAAFMNLKESGAASKEDGGAPVAAALDPPELTARSAPPEPQIEVERRPKLLPAPAAVPRVESQTDEDGAPRTGPTAPTTGPETAGAAASAASTDSQVSSTRQESSPNISEPESPPKVTQPPRITDASPSQRPAPVITESARPVERRPPTTSLPAQPAPSPPPDGASETGTSDGNLETLASPLEEERNSPRLNLPQVWVGDLVEAGEGVTPPLLVRSSGVRISQNSDNAGFKTPLEMQILVDHNGNVTEVTLGEGGAGLSPRATRRAIAATTKTRFVAAQKNGVPVKMWIPVVIDLESL